MSYSTMIAAAGITPGQPGSLFKIPCAEGLGELYVARSSFDFMGTVVNGVDPLFDIVFYIDHMDQTINLINDHLVPKIANTPSQLAACVAASSVTERARTIDAAVTGTDYPNVIEAAFPSKTVSSDSVVTGAFVTISESPALVTTCVTQVYASFDSVNSSMSSVYAAIQSAGGPVINNGADLLSYMVAANDAVKTSVTAAIESDMAAQEAIKTATVIADDGYMTLRSAFMDAQVRETSAYNFVTSQLTGNASVAMLMSKSPDVALIMSQCVDSAQVTDAALAVASKLNHAPVPGFSVITALKTNKPLLEENSPNVSPTPGPDVKYSDEEIAIMSNSLLQQTETVTNVQLELSNWMKANIEDWKPLNDYNSKKVAAGYSLEHPDGVNPNPTIRAIWINVRDQLQDKMDYYNSTLLPRYNSVKLALAQMTLERERRMYFGRNPYTFLASRGEPVPENEQTVYFDTTK